MRTLWLGIFAGLAARQVAGHAMFMYLWIDGVDKIRIQQSSQLRGSRELTVSNDSTCARKPFNNAPVTDVTSPDMACNKNPTPAEGICEIPAGSNVTVEMHQQPKDRNCANEGIGGAHWGPVQIYLAKVPDAAAAVGATADWFKIFQSTWASVGSSGSGDGASDAWGTKDLNKCCGKVPFKMPSDLPAGDYLMRAEALALHASFQPSGGQFYSRYFFLDQVPCLKWDSCSLNVLELCQPWMTKWSVLTDSLVTCYQIKISGGMGNSTPPTVKLPGAYTAQDPGILISIYQKMTSYIAPGPNVYPGGTVRVPTGQCLA